MLFVSFSYETCGLKQAPFDVARPNKGEGTFLDLSWAFAQGQREPLPPRTDFTGSNFWFLDSLRIIRRPPLDSEAGVVYPSTVVYNKCICVVISLFYGASALGATDSIDYPVTGIVRAPASEGSILIEHEAIAAYMPAMTMPFTAINQKEVAELLPGDRVKFILHVSNKDANADGFIKIGHVAAPMPTRNTLRLKEGDLLPPFTLTDQDGKQRSQADYAGKQVVLTFIFTRCPVPNFCPLISSQFTELQTKILADPQLRDRVRLLSITIDPEHDSPKVLRAYGTGYGADFSVWNFLTGNKETIVGLQRAFSVFSQPANGTIDHTLCTALLSPEGRVISLWRGTGWATSKILAALKEESAARE